MKKIYIAMTVLGTVLLSSCVQEKNFSDITVGENEIAFVMQGAATRSAEDGVSYASRGITIPMGVIDGESLYLEETIEELNPSPATKGAPAYTVTLPNLYPTMGVYAAGKFGDAAFGKMDAAQYNNSGWRYNHDYNGNPWPDDETKKVDFYLRMPYSGGGVSEYNATTFKLTSPLNGSEQADILFGQVTMSKEEHDKKLPGGMPVTMKHALTGIKFANGHANDNQTKTIITRVELIGLNMYGEGTVGTDGAVTWSGDPVLNTAENPFYLVFNNPEYKVATDDNPSFDPATNSDGTVNTTGDNTWNESLNGTSWTAAAADHNLNNADGSLTFWFIPQEVPDDLILKVYFTVKTPDSVDGFTSDACHVIELGELLNTKYQGAGNTGKLKWQAGQLRTYTVKPYDVDVEIEDNISTDTKSNLHVANTGNVDEYVRMLVIGNWYGWKPGEDTENVEPSILVGYKYAGTEEGLTDAQKREMVLPWYREGYPRIGDVYYATEAEAIEDGWVKATDGYGDPYGHFDSSFLLANLGDRDGKKNDWADASGGFYYTMPIGPGEEISYEEEAATRALFQSYTVTKIPDIYIATEGVKREKAVGVHLVMEIVVQAIAVPTVTVDGETKNVWWLEAWYEATKVQKLHPNDLKDGEYRNKTYRDLFKEGEYEPAVYDKYEIN